MRDTFKIFVILVENKWASLNISAMCVGANWLVGIFTHTSLCYGIALSEVKPCVAMCV